MLVYNYVGYSKQVLDWQMCGAHSYKVTHHPVCQSSTLSVTSVMHRNNVILAELSATAKAPCCLYLNLDQHLLSLS